MLTDASKIPRETYYACPHCMSKLQITVEDDESLKIVSLKSPEENYSDALERLQRTSPPPECPHHFGYLKNLPESASIPDECLTCPKIMQCFIRRE